MPSTDVSDNNSELSGAASVKRLEGDGCQAADDAASVKRLEGDGCQATDDAASVKRLEGGGCQAADDAASVKRLEGDGCALQDGEGSPRERVVEAEEPDKESNGDEGEQVIGIDLGTRFSCVGVWRNGRFEIIPDSFGNRTMASVVSFHGRARLVGANALTMKEVNPANTVYDIKRILGRQFDDEVVEKNKRFFTFNLIPGDDNSVRVELDPDDLGNVAKRTYRPEEICGCILAEIRRNASLYLRQDVTKAVITVPAYFTDAQRQATMDSARIAGLEVISMINEPTAAALAYGLGNKKWKKDNNGNVIVYDLGAGTLDVALMNISRGVFRILGVGGNTHLGGEDVDYLVMSKIMGDFQREHRIVELEASKLAQLKLKQAVENAKRVLSTNRKATICVENFADGKNIFCVLTRESFEEICHQFFRMCIHPLDDVLKSTGLTRDDIDDVILVGGSTRIPRIQEMILDYFRGTSITQLTASLNPDEAVSAGASAYAYIKTHHEDPFSKSLMLMDIIPLSLGVETLDKQMNIIVPRNTVIPISRSKRYTIDSDNQDEVSIKVFEGERKLTRNNFHLGTFQLKGFEKAPRGHVIIIVTFAIDINGILRVSAVEKRSDAQACMEISHTWGSKGRIQKEDLEKIIEEAQEHEEYDGIYSSKVGLIHKIKQICTTVIANVKSRDLNMTTLEKKKIIRQMKDNLKWVNSFTVETADLLELEEKKTYLNDNYAPMIVTIRKKDDQFQGAAESSACTTVQDCEEKEESNHLSSYESIERIPDPTDFVKEEIATLVKTINEMCQDILSVVNNSVTQLDRADVELVEDYISSVVIWLYATNASTTMEYIAKINEVNKFTESVLEKYSDKPVFDESSRLSIREELEYICLTLCRSEESKYFSLQKEDADKLFETTRETLYWLIEHPQEPDLVYQEKLDMINRISSESYDKMVRKNLNVAPEPISDSEDSDDEVDETAEEESTATTRIAEDLDRLLDSMPEETETVRVKVDMSKYAKPKKLRYHEVRRPRQVIY